LFVHKTLTNITQPISSQTLNYPADDEQQLIWWMYVNLINFGECPAGR